MGYAALRAGLIEGLVSEAMGCWDVPGAAVAVVGPDGLEFAAGFGLAEARSERRVTEQTLFQVCSTTKAFTTLLIARMVDEGRMGWDDRVSRHLPWFRLADPLADSAVTLRDLVTHRTGVSRHDRLWYYSRLGREEAVRRIGYAKPNTSFRSAYEYNNVMYMAAGEALASVYGGPFEDLLREVVLEPLGMTGVTCRRTEAQAREDHAEPHVRDEDGPLRVVPWVSLDSAAAAGGINAGAADFIPWMRLQLNEGTHGAHRIVSAERVRETHTPQIVDPLDAAVRAANPFTQIACYALGWGVSDYRGLRVISHSGGIDGVRTRVTLAPELGLGITVFTNADGHYLPEAVIRTAIDHTLGQTGYDWSRSLHRLLDDQRESSRAEVRRREGARVVDAPPSRQLEAFAGEYASPVFGAAAVTSEAGALALSWDGHRVPLSHRHYDVFLARDRAIGLDEPVEFGSDSDGRVSSVRFLGQDWLAASKVGHNRGS